MTTDKLMYGDHVSVESLSGVACWYIKECDGACGSVNCVVVVMVGDDREHHVDPEGVTALSEDEFCGGCGQIGCGHG